MEEMQSPREEVIAKTSAMAVASLICSLLGCLVVPAFLGLVFGIIGIVHTKEGTGRRGRGLAIAGVIISSLCIVILPFIFALAAILMPAFARAREVARQESCINNMKQIGLACYMYSQDNNGNLPDKGLESLFPDYIADSRVFICPQAEHSSSEIDSDGLEVRVVDYGYVKGLKMADNPGLIVAYDKELWHQDNRCVLFLDGHVEIMNENDFQQKLEETKGLMKQQSGP